MNGGEHCCCVEIMYPLLSTGNLNWEAMSFKPILQCWIWSFVIVKCFDRWTWTAPRKRWLDDINTATKTRVVTHSVFCILGAQNALLYVIILSRKVHLGRMSSGLLFLFNTTGEKNSWVSDLLCIDMNHFLSNDCPNIQPRVALMTEVTAVPLP